MLPTINLRKSCSRKKHHIFKHLVLFKQLSDWSVYQVLDSGRAQVIHMTLIRGMKYLQIVNLMSYTCFYPTTF